MSNRLVTIDTGENSNSVFSIDSAASPVELLAAAMRVGYVVIPAGALRRSGAATELTDGPLYVPASRIVQIA